MRKTQQFNGATWPLEQSFASTKSSQTLRDLPVSAPDADAIRFWLSLDDTGLWRQLPPAELPRVHFAKLHQDCPACATKIFRYGGFY